MCSVLQAQLHVQNFLQVQCSTRNYSGAGGQPPCICCAPAIELQKTRQESQQQLVAVWKAEQCDGPSCAGLQLNTLVVGTHHPDAAAPAKHQLAVIVLLERARLKLLRSAPCSCHFRDFVVSQLKTHTAAIQQYTSIHIHHLFACAHAMACSSTARHPHRGWPGAAVLIGAAR